MTRACRFRTYTLSFPSTSTTIDADRWLWCILLVGSWSCKPRKHLLPIAKTTKTSLACLVGVLAKLLFFFFFFFFLLALAGTYFYTKIFWYPVYQILWRMWGNWAFAGLAADQRTVAGTHGVGVPLGEMHMRGDNRENQGRNRSEGPGKCRVDSKRKHANLFIVGPTKSRPPLRFL